MIITDLEVLNTKCEDVLPNEAEELIHLLEKELDHSAMMGRQGIGLAAIQIGIPKKIAIVRINKQFSVNLINCRVEKGYNEFIFKEEGCLSFPNLVKDTKRYSEVLITNNLLYPHSFIASGVFAVCCQHEADHWNNITILDRAIKAPVITNTKVRPNDPCICGKIDPNTGKVRKYKKCCGG